MFRDGVGLTLRVFFIESGASRRRLLLHGGMATFHGTGWYAVRLWFFGVGCRGFRVLGVMACRGSPGYGCFVRATNPYAVEVYIVWESLVWV